MPAKREPYIRWFDAIGLEDVPLVGGKTASLGEMYRTLTGDGVRVPNGFAVTAEAYRRLIAPPQVQAHLKELLSSIDKRDVADFARRGEALRRVVYEAPLGDDLVREITAAYEKLEAQYGRDVDVAVRSSATAEDLPTASFAGQHESYLNIRGKDRLLDACKRCFASLFTDRAIAYRIDNGFDHFKVALSIAVQKMVRSDEAASGVMFTLDTESGFRDVVLINGAFGLGENVVQGAVDPDEFLVHKPTYLEGHRVVLRRRLGAKQLTMIYSSRTESRSTRNVRTSKTNRDRFCLTDDEVLTLAGYAIKVEQHYSVHAGHAVPMDLEWAKDGESGELFIIQARPETVVSQRPAGKFYQYTLKGKGKVVASGRAVGEKIATGPVRLISNAAALEAFVDGDVLVADTTSPDWEPVMKRAAAIVTNRGGRTCHAAIVARELGIPAVVGAGDATARLVSGQTVTVSCAEGEAGRIYDGAIPFDMREIDTADVPRPRTKVMINLGNPDNAFHMSFLPNDGVGLARLEFIIAEYIKAHPMALLHPDRVPNQRERRDIERLIRHYPDGGAYFIEKLSEGIGTLAAAFYPKPVIVRTSDFKTNEYANLLGGRSFEPDEANPMIGFRGASRYAHPNYEEGFALECAALKRVRNEMGLTNVRVMIPFCRRVQEAEAVLAAMAKHGLKRGENGLEVFVMCEIPNNVIQIDAFAKLFDGFSIGSNDLTQLVLGVDRDSEIVAFDFDERDPGVMEAIRQAVEGARRNGRHSGICGQAPSDFPEVAEFLVRQGIDSISLNPDTVIPTTVRIANIEADLAQTGSHRAALR